MGPWLRLAPVTASGSDKMAISVEVTLFAAQPFKSIPQATADSANTEDKAMDFAPLCRSSGVRVPKMVMEVQSTTSNVHRIAQKLQVRASSFITESWLLDRTAAEPAH